jgi:hypothetical protein
MNRIASIRIQMLFWNFIAKSIHWLQDVLSVTKTQREGCSITVAGVGSKQQALSAADMMPFIVDWYRGVKCVDLNSYVSFTLMTWCLAVGASLLHPLQQVTVHTVSQRHLGDRLFLLTFHSPFMRLSLHFLPFLLLLLLLYVLLFSFLNILIFTPSLSCS